MPSILKTQCKLNNCYFLYLVLLSISKRNYWISKVINTDKRNINKFIKLVKKVFDKRLKGL